MPSRLHSIDAARAFLLLLGLPYHMAGVVLYQMAAPRVPFADSPTIVLFVTISHVFRMFAFFILSGYFSAMMSAKRGRSAWLADRMTRLGLPLLAGLATVGVAQFWLMAHLLGKPAPSLFGLPSTLGELWFLCTLILLCLTYLAVPPIALQRAGDAVARLHEGRRIMPALLAALAIWGLVHGLLRVLANRTELPHDLLQVLLGYFFYLPAFAIGALAWHSHVRERFFSAANGRVVLLAAIFLVTYLALDTMVRSLTGLPPEKSVFERLLSNGLAAPVALLCSLIVFAVMSRLFQRRSRFVSLVAEGALAIYIVHIPFQQIIASQMQGLGLPPLVLWLVGTLLGFVLSFGIFLVLRTNQITAALFCGKPWRRDLHAAALQSAPRP